MPFEITDAHTLSTAERLQVAAKLAKFGYAQLAGLMTAEIAQEPAPQSFAAFLVEAQAILDAEHDGIPLRSLNLESFAYWYARGESAADVIARGLGAPERKERS